MDAAVQLFLEQADLKEFAQPLQDLGVCKLDDLSQLEADDLTEIGMKKLQKRRFERAMQSRSEAEPEAKRQRVVKPVARPTMSTSGVKVEQAGYGAPGSVSQAEEEMSVDGDQPLTDEAEGDLEVPEEGKLDEDLLEHFNTLGLAQQECVRWLDCFGWWLDDM